MHEYYNCYMLHPPSYETEVECAISIVGGLLWAAMTVVL